MARVPQVTRTIITTKVTVMCLDIDTNTPLTQEYTLPRTYKDEKAILKAVDVANEGTSVKAVHVVSTEVVNTLYGMTEAEFIKVAQVLPPRDAVKSDEEATAVAVEEV